MKYYQKEFLKEIEKGKRKKRSDLLFYDVTNIFTYIIWKIYETIYN